MVCALSTAGNVCESSWHVGTPAWPPPAQGTGGEKLRGPSGWQPQHKYLAVAITHG